jgi:hypothetical protein
MASAARDETGSVAIGARKSAPIVFIGVVRGGRDCPGGRSTVRHLAYRPRGNNIGFPPYYPSQPSDNSWSGSRQSRRGVSRRRRLGCRRRTGFKRAVCLCGFLNLLDRELVEGRSPGRHDVELGAAGRTPEFDAAQFNNLRMKPFRAAQRASDRSPLIVRDSQLVTTAGTRKYCQRFAPSTAVSANFSRRSKTQEHPRFAGIGNECNLKAVALKAVKSRNRLCEKDSQRTATGRFGQEYASPSSSA